MASAAFPVFRAAALFVASAIAFATVWVHRVEAEVDGALLGFGARALEFPGTTSGAVRTVEVNGIRVSVRGQSVDQPLEVVHDHYERRCAAANGSTSPALRALVALSSQSDLLEHAGYVACVDLRAANFGELALRLRRFAETWDLAALGAARYVYATRSLEDPSSATFVLSMWVDGPFELRRVLPLDGADAPGRGIEGVPRPADSQRLLSFREDSRPSAAVIYEARSASPAGLLSLQRSELAARGWSIVERSSGEEVQIDGTYLLAATRRDRLVTILAHQRQPGSAFVIHLEAGAP